MQSLTEDNFLSKVESELEKILRGSDLAGLASFEDEEEVSDFDALESEFAELSEFISDSDETKSKNSQVNTLIEVLEKAQDLVTVLRGEPESDEGNDDSINKQLDQVASAVNQAHDLLKRLDKEVKELRETVNSHQA